MLEDPLYSHIINLGLGCDYAKNRWQSIISEVRKPPAFYNDAQTHTCARIMFTMRSRVRKNTKNGGIRFLLDSAEGEGDKSHPNVDTMFYLLEVPGIRHRIDIGCNLVYPRKRMH